MGLGNIALTVAGFDAADFYGRVFQLNLPGTVTELCPGASWGVATAGKDAPGTAVTANKAFAIPVAALSSSATAPSVTTTRHARVQPPVAASTLTGTPPNVQV